MISKNKIHNIYQSMKLTLKTNIFVKNLEGLYLNGMQNLHRKDVILSH